MAQQVNQELIDNLVHYFRRRYAPEHAFADAVGMLQMFPGVVGIWPMSMTDGTGQALNVTGANHLTNNNVVTFNAASDGLVPYTNFVAASSQYFSHADGAPFDILGTEAYIGQPGLTMGCWVRQDALTARAFIGKFGAAGQRSYYLADVGTTKYWSIVSGDGTALTHVESSVSPLADVWRFVCARFTPSSELKIWVNSTTNVNTTSIPASIFNSTSEFRIGATADGAGFFDGHISLAFLCAATVPDHFIETFYDFTRPLFGV